jgi:hypothetical protein
MSPRFSLMEATFFSDRYFNKTDCWTSEGFSSAVLNELRQLQLRHLQEQSLEVKVTEEGLNRAFLRSQFHLFVAPKVLPDTFGNHLLPDIKSIYQCVTVIRMIN